MFSMKCTCSDSGAFAGAGVVCNVQHQCKGCSVLPPKDNDKKDKTGWVSLKFYLILTFQKTTALVYFLYTVWDSFQYISE